MKKISIIPIVLLLVRVQPAFALEPEPKDPDWPRKLETQSAVINIYQPQVNSLDGSLLDARAAFSIKKKGEDLVFGAMWFSSRIETDFDTRLVDLKEIRIQSVKFPDADENQEKSMIAMLESEISAMDLSMALDRLLASLELAEKSEELAEQLNTAPPNVIYKDEAAVLVLIDGEPILEDIEGTGLRYVANTPYFIIYNTADGFFYLKGGKWWYRAGRVEDTWREIDNPPGAIVKIAEELEGTYDTDVDSIARTMKFPPKIVLSKEPAELIITDGEPELASLEGTGLLYVQNTENEILMDIHTQHFYLLISGRWYRSRFLGRNDWVYTPPEELPEEFTLIPPESEMGSVRVNIPGTREAKEAILENEIPQTAVIDRKNTDIEVEYDGKPEFESIKGTEMSYARNTDKSVLLIGNRYYAVDNAVWYVSTYPSGPWSVCVEVPRVVYTIPPSYPVYNVKYVYVYDHTPDVVYVGYTPGYYHSYRYRGTIVYGTGYHYRPWYRKYYYPRHYTYGFGVHYHPFSGWGFSWGISYGWVGYRYYRPYYHTAWWGPCGYRYGYRHGYYHGFNRGYYRGYYRGYHYGIYTSSRSGYVAGYRDGSHYTANHNIYKSSRARGVVSTGTRPTTYGSRAKDSGIRSSYSNPRQTDRKNNVYSDREGNLYRKRGNTWQERTGGSWKKSELPEQTAGREEDIGRSRTSTTTRTTVTRQRTRTADPIPASRSKSISTKRPAPVSTGRGVPASVKYNSMGTGSPGRSTQGGALNRESRARSSGSQRTYNYQKSIQQKESRSIPQSRTGRSRESVKKSTVTRSSGRSESSGRSSRPRRR